MAGVRVHANGIALLPVVLYWRWDMVNIENTTFRKNLFVIFYIVNFYSDLFTLTVDCFKNPKIISAANHSKNPYAIVRPNRVFNDQIKRKGPTKIAMSAITKIVTNAVPFIVCFIVYLT